MPVIWEQYKQKYSPEAQNRGIHLTQVPTIYSVARYESLNENSGEMNGDTAVIFLAAKSKKLEHNKNI